MTISSAAAGVLSDLIAQMRAKESHELAVLLADEIEHHMRVMRTAGHNGPITVRDVFDIFDRFDLTLQTCKRIGAGSSQNNGAAIADRLEADIKDESMRGRLPAPSFLRPAG